MSVEKVICGVRVSYSDGAKKDFKSAHGIDLDLELEKYVKREQSERKHEHST